MTTSKAVQKRSMSASEKLIDHLKQCKNLPSLPWIALRINELSQDSVAGLADVADIVSADPVLTERILRLANSPLYAQNRNITNLRQAIMLLGLDGMLTMALSFSLVSKMRFDGNGSLDYRYFWQRSLFIAVACRTIGSRENIASKVDLFLAGLLQDIGMLALDKTFPRLYRGIGPLQANHRHIQAWERKSLNTDHSAIGAWLLEHWKLPQRWLPAVAGSHDPDAVKMDAECTRLARCLAVSAATADIWYGRDHARGIHEAAECAQTLLGIESEDFTSLLMPIMREFQEIARILNINPGDSRRMQTILNRAIKLLMAHQGKHKGTKSKESGTSPQPRSSEPDDVVRASGLAEACSRDHFAQILHEEFDSAKQYGWPLTVAFIDLDHFDQTGKLSAQLSSDKAFDNIMRLLCSLLRETDIICRYDEQWFSLLLPGTGLDGARVVCRRLVDAFRSPRYEVGEGVKVAIVASIGVAVQEGVTKFVKAHELLTAAEQALKTAKQNGRNCAAFYRDNPASP